MPFHILLWVHLTCKHWLGNKIHEEHKRLKGHSVHGHKNKKSHFYNIYNI